ncbi:MAG: hypothetical protein Kow00107_09510 [Planctomycetota bacterium]
MEMQQKLYEGKRFSFPIWYWLVGFAATAVLVTSSVTMGEAGLHVARPLPLFLGAVLGAVSLAFYTQSYVRLGGGRLFINKLFARTDFPTSSIESSTLEEGGSITLRLKNGTSHSIRLFHVRSKERLELVELLKRLAPFSDNRKATGDPK